MPLRFQRFGLSAHECLTLDERAVAEQVATDGRLRQSRNVEQGMLGVDPRVGDDVAHVLGMARVPVACTITVAR